MKKKKLQLNDLRVQSFITEIDPFRINALRAGGPGDSDDGAKGCPIEDKKLAPEEGGGVNVGGDIVSALFGCSYSLCTDVLC